MANQDSVATLRAGEQLFMELFGADYLVREKAWRSGLALRLRLLAQWGQTHQLLQAASASRIESIQRRLDTDTVTLAFVGETSRGKSELINAAFFGSTGTRLLPVGPGRTTLCPVELLSDPEQAPHLRLLPIGTRSDPRPLSAWHSDVHAWVQPDSPVADAHQCAAALANNGLNTAGAAQTAHEYLPRWRHALLNLPPTLLAQGVRIVDTPGLNALGAEHELALELVPQCDVIAFVLAADAGVTASDLAIWRDHLAGRATEGRELLAVLNKTDMLWDPLSESHTNEARLHQTQLDVAEALQLPPQRVLTVSARQGLLAKITGDPVLLERSGLPQLEQALADILFVERHFSWRKSLDADFVRIKSDMQSLLNARLHDLARARGTVTPPGQTPPDVAPEARTAVQATQLEPDPNPSKVRTVQSILHKRRRKVRQVLQMPALDAAIAKLGSDLRQSEGFLDLNQAYAHIRRSVQTQWEPLAQWTEDIGQIFGAWSLEGPAPSAAPGVVGQKPDISDYADLIDQAIDAHLQFLGSGSVHKLRHAEFTDRLTRALISRIKDICGALDAEFGSWYLQIDDALAKVLHAPVPDAQRTLDALRAEEETTSKLLHTLDAYFLSLAEVNADY